MNDAESPRPRPARLPQSGSGAKPTPARDLARERTRPSGEPEAQEVSLKADGTRWTVRVLGRSGSASGVSPPLMLLGFWEEGSTDDTPSLECLMVDGPLEGLSEDGLLAALAAASEPPDPDRKQAFFPDTGQSRRRSRGSG